MGTGLITAAGAKCVGRGHMRELIPCQDAIAIKLKRGMGCIALSDGAGSRKHSDRGAQICVDAVARYLSKHIDNLVKLARTQPESAGEMILQAALTAMRRYVRRKNYGLDDLACTLLFAAYKDREFLVGHLGDGVIAIQNDDIINVLSYPDNGEHINSTFFVTDKCAHSRLRIYHTNTNCSAGIMLMSDGTAESLFNRSTGGLAPAAKTIFEWATVLTPKKLSSVLEQNLTQVFRTKTTDDCSILILKTPPSEK